MAFAVAPGETMKLGQLELKPELSTEALLLLSFQGGVGALPSPKPPNSIAASRVRQGLRVAQTRDELQMLFSHAEFLFHSPSFLPSFLPSLLPGYLPALTEKQFKVDHAARCSSFIPRCRCRISRPGASTKWPLANTCRLKKFA